MSKTRMSLYYLVVYLLLGGVGLLAMPKLALRLLLATGDYGTVFPRLVGMMMVGLAIIVVQIIRLDLTELIPTTLAVRAFFLLCLGAFYLESSDRLFLVLLGIVGLGFALTGASYLSERSKRPLST